MAKFNIGDLVICTEEYTYYYTNTESLCVVASLSSCGYLYVKPIATTNIKSSDYALKVRVKFFKHITFKEYFEKFPNARLLETDLNKIEEYKKFSLSIENKTNKINILSVLSQEKVDELKTEIINLLKEYGYESTDKGIMKILDTWVEEKYDIIKMMEKHPNYNGKFQIAFDTDFKREINKDVIHNFFHYLENVMNKIIKNNEILIDGKTYGELKKEYLYNKYICSAMNDFIDILYYKLDIIKEDARNNLTYKNILYKEYNEKRNSLYEKIFNDHDYNIYNDFFIHTEYYKNYVEKAIFVINFFEDYYNNIIDDDAYNIFNEKYPELKIHKGQKTSRVLNKLCTMFGFNTDENYNKMFAEYSDTINPLLIKRHTVLSCHPVDYLTMSFGNSWSSCHTIDKENVRDMPNNYSGQYSAGTLSYMLDNTSIIFYTVDKDYNGNNLELEPKINRNMFHIGEEKIIQGRLYPQVNDGNSSFYTDIRNIVQKVISDCMNVPNLWKLKKGTSACYQVIDSKGVNYEDYFNFNDCNISYLKKDGSDNENINRITVGENPICPYCGHEHENSNMILCDDCVEKHYMY